MRKLPKGRCTECGRKFTLELKGQVFKVPYHTKRVRGELDPVCPGADKLPA